MTTRDQTIGVIDYGMGNLRSVSKAIEHLGGRVYVGSSQRKLAKMKKLVLPGVGAFGDAMRELRKLGLIRLIEKSVTDGKPFLGICLGLQLLFERSEENPGVTGLGIWKGMNAKFKRSAGSNRKIPHMGWNQVTIRKKGGFLSQVRDQSHFYFVHSYYAKPKDKSLVMGVTNYGISFPAILGSSNVFAVQFHPEKSQSVGLQILTNFVGLKT